MEEQLLQYYYFLTKRKVLTASLPDYWKTPSHTIYTLLEWEKTLVEQEEKELKQKRNKSHKESIPDSSESIALYNQLKND